MGLHLSDSELLDCVDEDNIVEAAEDIMGISYGDYKDKLISILTPLSDSLREEGKINEAIEVENIIDTCR